MYVRVWKQLFPRDTHRVSWKYVAHWNTTMNQLARGYVFEQQPKTRVHNFFSVQERTRVSNSIKSRERNRRLICLKQRAVRVILNNHTVCTSPLRCFLFLYRAISKKRGKDKRGQTVPEFLVTPCPRWSKLLLLTFADNCNRSFLKPRVWLLSRWRFRWRLF